MILFNDGWQFVKLPTGSTYADAQAAVWTAVDLPHDFLIPQENNLPVQPLAFLSSDTVVS